MPSDDADRAQAAMEVMEEHREVHMRTAHLEPNGTCYYCGASLRDGWRFCDAECRWSYDYEQERRRVNGSPD
jgi:predicted nucleic acid-binding Zn ribbon protein